MSFVYFILLLGGLIFFHELGHFILAKAMGVRVITFSIGFDPSLISKKFGDTEYRLAAVPLGGYVKMFGDEVGEDVGDKALGIKGDEEVEDDPERAFNNKPLWRRTLIVLAGPVFNLLLPFIVFFLVYLTYTELLPSYIGAVKKDGPAWNAGIRSGDTIVKMDGEDVDYWWQMEERINSSVGTEIEVELARGDGTFTTTVVPEEIEIVKLKQVDLVDREGRIQVTPVYVRPMVGVREASPVHSAGLRNWDLVVAVDGEKVKSFADMRERLAVAGSHALDVLREETLGNLGHALFSQFGDPLELTLEGPVPDSDLYEAEMVVHHVDDGSGAARVGLESGDRIISLAGHEFPLWYIMETYLADHVGDSHELVWEDAEGRHTTEFKLTQLTVKGEFNEDRRIVKFGAYNHSSVGSPEGLKNNSLCAFAAHQTWKETYEAYRITLWSVAGLMAGKVPIEDMGGPILIYDMASRTEEHGWEYFFRIMVWLSISLGIINLFPIPILDGGHLLFFAIEAVIRRPVSVKARQVAAYIGLVLIGMLMIVVFKNDIARNWDSISNWFSWG